MAKILVVEDDADVLVVLRAMLEQAGHVIETGETNQQATAIIEQGGFDLVISDVALRGGNGESIAKSADTLGVPILLISGEPKRLETLRGGTIPFLQKPFRVDELIATVDRLLDARSRPPSGAR